MKMLIRVPAVVDIPEEATHWSGTLQDLFSGCALFYKQNTLDDWFVWIDGDGWCEQSVAWVTIRPLAALSPTPC